MRENLGEQKNEPCAGGDDALTHLRHPKKSPAVRCPTFYFHLRSVYLRHSLFAAYPICRSLFAAQPICGRTSARSASAMSPAVRCPQSI
jgi:hypothetical protein